MPVVPKHPLRALAPLFALLLLLGSPSQALACSCGPPTPLLSPYSADAAIFQGTVLRYGEDAAAESRYMELSVDRGFRGELDGDTLQVSGTGICAPPVGQYPIGSSWLFRLSVPAPPQRPVLSWCNPEYEVVDGHFEGYVSNYDCAHENGSNCQVSERRISLNAFDLLQQHYFAGVDQALQLCHANELNSCPDVKAHYLSNEQTLILPYVGIYRGTGHLRDGGPPLGAVQLSLRLLEGANGQLLFDLLGLQPVEPAAQ